MNQEESRHPRHVVLGLRRSALPTLLARGESRLHPLRRVAAVGALVIAANACTGKLESARTYSDAGPAEDHATSGGSTTPDGGTDAGPAEDDATGGGSATTPDGGTDDPSAGACATAATTGIAGVGLTESDLNPSPPATGRWTITEPGIYSDFVHNGIIDVQATGVTLRRCLVRARSKGLVVRSSGSDLVVEDCTIVGSGTEPGVDICAASLGYGNYVARRVDVSGCADGFKLGGATVLIEDSYVHDLTKSAGTSGPGSGTHNDGFQLNNSSSAGVVTIRGTRTDLQHCTSNRQFQLGGSAEMLLIENNCFSGLHGILNGGAGVAAGIFRNNVIAGSPERGPFTDSSRLLYSGDLSRIARTGNRFETGEPADTDTRTDSYVCE